VVTHQEHFLNDELTPFQYILEAVPDYLRLKKIIEDYAEHTDGDMTRLQEFTDALQEFGERDFYALEDVILTDLGDYGLDAEQVNSPMIRLSGGEKRFVELVKVTHAQADLALIDEPTNHMDYIGKARFITWLQNAKHAVCVISHDRDVLAEVDRIIEVKDKKADTFRGNYAAYLKHNGVATMNQVSLYEDSIRRLALLDKQIEEARAKKARDPRAKQREVVLMREREQLQAETRKPSFWIDQETLGNTKSTLLDGYHKYKDKNIRIQTHELNEFGHELLTVDALSIGYDKPLFEDVSFRLSHGDRIFLKGRNGSGKSSLLKTILATIDQSSLPTFPFDGEITFNPKIRVGVYEQEVDVRFFDLTLGQAVQSTYQEHKLTLTDQALNALLSSYLFQPLIDRDLLVSQLSGGQKARFQLIRLLCHGPNLLILDEPTNHLDLPSIEELEKALSDYRGAILYVSHDSYFVNGMGGDTVMIGA